MRALLVTVPLAALGCADLSHPHPIRVSRESAIDGMPDNYVPPEQMVRIVGSDGKPRTVPRLDPSTHLPMRVGDVPARAGR